MKIPSTILDVYGIAGKTVKAAIQGVDAVLIQFTDGELIALGGVATDYDGNPFTAQLYVTDAEFDDFDMDELFASGILTPEQVEAYYEQERQLAAYREAEQKEHRRKQYQELKAEFEPEPEIHA